MCCQSLSEVDHEKYPEVTQKYRFELADEVKENAPEDTMAKSLEVNPHQVDIVDLSNDEPAVSDAEGMKETEEQADPALLVFLDADTLEEKYEILKSMRDSMTDRLVDDFAVALDIVIPEGEHPIPVIRVFLCLMCCYGISWKMSHLLKTIPAE